MDEYHRVARVDEVPPGDMKPCEAGGRRVAPRDADGRLYRSRRCVYRHSASSSTTSCP